MKRDRAEEKRAAGGEWRRAKLVYGQSGPSHQLFALTREYPSLPIPISLQLVGRIGLHGDSHSCCLSQLLSAVLRNTPVPSEKGLKALQEMSNRPVSDSFCERDGPDRGKMEGPDRVRKASIISE